ncbi:response regulator [Ramlibacter monticola]|uniref:Response regulator n=1 Tax=Ramlibacter monticola TaxID=1926872 RepID=A0A937CT53_9BURK|nr:response regulator [Ramlibacter monticola]MBL0391294.1 response regulator [Ramlibacter monticola]
MSALALKFGLELFIGRRRAQAPRRSVLQHFMKHRSGKPGPAPLAGRRILLAEGAQALADALRQGGAEVVPAGAAVFDALRAHEGVDAVILSLETPGLDGPAVARAIRAAGAPWSEVPVVAVATRSDASAEAALAAAGIDGLLLKPVETTLLYETLTRFMASGAARAQRAQPAASATATSVATEALLNLQRLESYRRIGMLDDLVNDYLPEMARLVAAVHDAARESDAQASLAALHSLLGMSGEAGAQGLYQQVRKLYVPLLEHGQWPAAPDWLPQLNQLARRTEEALRAYCSQQARSSAS